MTFLFKNEKICYFNFFVKDMFNQYWESQNTENLTLKFQPSQKLCKF